MTPLDLFLDGYIACALWSSTDDAGEPLDSRFSGDDLSPETLRELRSDAKDFFDVQLDLINQTPDHYTYSAAGHDF